MTRPADPIRSERADVSAGGSDDTESRWLEVFRSLAGGRVAALDELYNLVAADVFRLALWRTGSREDAEDVVQDVFVRVAEQGPRLASVRHPKRWLLTVAHRRAVDLARRRRRRESESVEGIPFLVATGADPDRAVEAAQISRHINRLPAKQREVVLLRHFADCTFADIGRIIGVPTFTAASRYRLAVAKLRRLLENNHETTS